MSRPLFYDYEGKPIDALSWAELFEDAPARLVALSIVGEFGTVSTVWLGIDYAEHYDKRDDDRPPLIYESKVFGGPLNGATARYPNREKALLGHDSMVERLKEIDQEEENGDG